MGSDIGTGMFARDLGALLKVSKALSAERDLTKLLGIILDAATRLIHADRCSVFVVDMETGDLWTQVAQGSETIRLPRGSGIAGTVAETGEVINIPDAYADPRFNPENDKRSGYRTHAMLCMPLISHSNSVVGVVQALNKHGSEAFVDYDQELLAALCSHAAVAIDTAQLIARDLERQKLAQEMDIARSIQQSLLPQSLPARDGWAFADWQQPCDATGGDYHDAIPVGDAVDIVVGDVSGHGIGAALMMSSARSALRALHPRVSQLDVLMADLNRLLEADMAADTFMTMLIMRLADGGGVSYVSAGHEPPMLYRAAEDRFEELDSTGILLSALDDSEYDIEHCQPMQAGDVLVAFTDGLFEAVDPMGEQMGMERVQAIIAQYAAQGAEAVRDALVTGHREHVAGAEIGDDTTIVVVGRV